jgi:hypothetical protein
VGDKSIVGELTQSEATKSLLLEQTSLSNNICQVHVVGKNNLYYLKERSELL